MTDAELMKELIAALSTDTTAPRIDQQINPTDPVAIEIMLHEADFAIEGYMEKWKGFRGRFSDPSVFDAFVYAYQMRVRRNLKSMIADAQKLIAEIGGQSDEGPEDGEEWYGE